MVQILCNKYLDNFSVLDVPKKNDSTTWNLILKATLVLRNGFGFRIGNNTTSFWYSWTTFGTLASVIIWVDIHNISLCIHDLIINGNWNFNTLYTFLSSNIQNHVKSLPPCLHNDVPDRITWADHLDDIYTTRSGYFWLLFFSF